MGHFERAFQRPCWDCHCEEAFFSDIVGTVIARELSKRLKQSHVSRRSHHVATHDPKIGIAMKAHFEMTLADLDLSPQEFYVRFLLSL